VVHIIPDFAPQTYIRYQTLEALRIEAGAVIGVVIAVGIAVLAVKEYARG
jgi:hypothetical protein